MSEVATLQVGFTIHMHPWGMCKWAFSALVVVGCAGLIVLAVSTHDLPVHHWSTVQEGVLYRSGQPDDDQLRYLLARYGIRTVVNLRGAQPGEDWHDDERQICAERGVACADIPLGTPGETPEELTEFLRIATSPSSQPVLVHCESGSARTGFAVAAYRIAIQGWGYEVALAEARRYRFNEKVSTNREYAAILKAVAAGDGWRPGIAAAGVQEPSSRQAATTEEGR